MSDADDGYDVGGQPHDAFFKETFSDPKRAGTFFRSHLPAEVVEVIKLETLETVPGSFVKTSLQQAHSDLLFKVEMGEGRELFLYLLFEHQTKVDPTMPLRLLAYQTEILLKYHKIDDGLLLPPVISFVLHQGAEEWSVSCRLADFYALAADRELDVETVFKNVESKKRLKEAMSSIAEKLIARGEARGKVKGELQGKIKALEEFLVRDVSSSESLSKLTAEELEAYSLELEQEYRLKYKKD